VYKPVPTRVDYVQLEHEVQAWWDREQILQKYLTRNQDASERWSFIDGPITANNPMGVHHAWGRSYKDLYNRFWTRALDRGRGREGDGLHVEARHRALRRRRVR
jgi:isoleucyl-tRNA synthetase